ncbi:MAG: ATPase, T2SS/T4P/T4SS family [Phycisphaeraceae bacterium]
MPQLEIQMPNGTKRLDLEKVKGKLTIGRHPDNRLRLNDNEVSRFHCELEASDHGYLLRDLGSRNGTKIDDELIAEVMLQHGDTFVVGGTTFRYRDAAAARAEKKATAAATAGRAKPGGDPPLADPEQAIAMKDADIFLDEDSEDEQAEAARPVGRSRSDFGSGAIGALATVGRDVPYDATDVSLINARGKTVHAATDEDDKTATAQTIGVLRLLLLACIRTGASDLHMEPKQAAESVRMRVDGTMVEATELPQAMARKLHSLIKVLCDIDIANRNNVQEGHFSVQVPDRRIDYRVSFTPSMFGQKLVLRVLDPMNSPQQLRDLGLPGWMYRQLRDVSRQDTGMVLVCGPTGSGKTTTLYAVLRQIDARQRNVITIEDPVEYEVDGVTQIPVDEDHGKDFNSLLRSCLRQDPDVIVLGEIRDAETATTAMQAATTGHLVLSTVHAKDTIGTIFRLLDLGVEPYLVASTLNLLLAQRLARTLCPHCKVPKRPTPSQNMKLGKLVEGVKEIYAPGGCHRCFETGYVGRQAISELLTTNDDVRDVILRNPNIGELKKAISSTHFTPLREVGMDLVIKGETSLQEIERVIGFE